jgi:Fe-S-cluster-containing dehydrogenase component/DMSO reductase anchor subunit
MSLLTAVAAPEETPIDRWLAQQSQLTAVERFSRHHDRHARDLQARYYRDLLPARAPGRGEQYGFEVDLDACTGCKACVAACHSLNGLDEGESWRSVTLLTGSTASPVQQTVTAACHHCVDPACMKGCPVDAYEKDPVTGIVVHLDDQCIGCSYCTLTCPYEVPVFNHDRGIVRKCDMCAGRLADGEAPACVQACPNGAIAIRVVDVAATVATSATATLVPGAPPSSITVPTTVYRSARGRADAVGSPLRPAATPAKAHPPLAVMLVLTQLSVGAFVADLALRALTDRASDGLPVFDAMVVVAVGVLALAASLFHLGRPRYAYRAVIGLRHSWLSREVVAFGAFTSLVVPYALLLWTDRLPSAVPWLGGAVAASGVVGVVCSVFIYSTTRRSSWRTRSVTATFFLSAAVSGLATVIWASSISRMLSGDRTLPDARGCALVLIALALVKLLGEASALRHLRRPLDDERARRARLLVRELRPVTSRRFVAGFVGGVLLPVVYLASAAVAPVWVGALLATVALAAVVIGELAERSLFFTAASAPR